MATAKVYLHGMTSGNPGGKIPTPGQRAKCGGWSTESTRSLSRFLRSIIYDEIGGALYSFTLTLRHCPASPDDWHKVRRAFLRDLKRSGVIDSQWLAEWQRRGVPHLHGIVVLPSGLCSSVVTNVWLHHARKYEPIPRCQTVREIYDPVGWAQYMQKHSARGVHHYQRSKLNIPEAWKGLTGRMWGATRGWPRMEPVDVEMSQATFHKLRRALAGYELAKARDGPDSKQRRRRIAACRTARRCPEKWKSMVRGVSADVPLDVSMPLILWLQAQDSRSP